MESDWQLTYDLQMWRPVYHILSITDTGKTKTYLSTVTHFAAVFTQHIYNIYKNIPHIWSHAPLEPGTVLWPQHTSYWLHLTES